MDKGILLVVFIAVLVVVFSVYYIVVQVGGGTAAKQGTPATYYIINYGAGNATGVAEKLSDGSYKLENGTVILPSERVSVAGTYEAQKNPYCCQSNCPLAYDPVCGSDGNTYVNLCGAALANVRVAYMGVCGLRRECVTPCVEPKPSLRFVCADGKIVENRVDCQGNESCAYAVKKYFVCPDGSNVDDPQSCNATAGTFTAAPNVGIKTIYVCSDGREATSEADCSANCVPATAAVTHVSANFGSGGAIGTVYECWDGSVTKNANECPPFCSKQCTCGQEEDPVCANGRTYLNPCLARCDNITEYTRGQCEQPGCANTGQSCVPAATVGQTLTMLNHYQSPTCCEPGSYCSQNGVCTPVGQCVQASQGCTRPAATYTTAYVPNQQGDCCQGLICNENNVCGNRTTTNQCVQVGQGCTRPNVTYTTAYLPSMQGNCCQGLSCDESSVCTNRTACVTSGNACGTVRYTTGNAVITNYLGSCCQGYSCVDNTCAIAQCVQELGSCKADGDCCQGMTCSQFGQCRKPCVQDGGTCKSSTECCGASSCVDGVCKIETQQTQQLCSGAVNGPEWTNSNSCATGYYKGVWDTYCGYCGDTRTEYRYYCLKNYTYSAVGAPSETLTDQVTIASTTCKNGCSGTTCK